jgi:hypothetical protein
MDMEATAQLWRDLVALLVEVEVEVEVDHG